MASLVVLVAEACCWSSSLRETMRLLSTVRHRIAALLQWNGRKVFLLHLGGGCYRGQRRTGPWCHTQWVHVCTVNAAVLRGADDQI